jgi:hypothetical protein
LEYAFQPRPSKADRDSAQAEGSGALAAGD